MLQKELTLLNDIQFSEMSALNYLFSQNIFLNILKHCWFWQIVLRLMKILSSAWIGMMPNAWHFSNSLWSSLKRLAEIVLLVRWGGGCLMFRHFQDRIYTKPGYKCNSRQLYWFPCSLAGVYGDETFSKMVGTFKIKRVFFLISYYCHGPP